jgi:hypothetical protein
MKAILMVMVICLLPATTFAWNPDYDDPIRDMENMSRDAEIQFQQAEMEYNQGRMRDRMYQMEQRQKEVELQLDNSLNRRSYLNAQD